MFVPDCLLSGSIPIQMICGGHFRRYCAPFMNHDSRSGSAVVKLFQECPTMTMQTLCRLIQENFDSSYPPTRTLLDSSQWKVYIQTTTIGQYDKPNHTFRLLDQTCPVLEIPIYILGNHCISVLAESSNHVQNSIGTIEPELVSIDNMIGSATMTSISNVNLLYSKLAAETEHLRKLEAQSLAKSGQSIVRYQQRVQGTTARYKHALEQARLQATSQ